MYCGISRLDVLIKYVIIYEMLFSVVPLLFITKNFLKFMGK